MKQVIGGDRLIELVELVNSNTQVKSNFSTHSGEFSLRGGGVGRFPTSFT